MKLFHSAASPFVRKVMIVLHETGQLDDVEILDIATTATRSDSALIAANPLARIPAMLDDNGTLLQDSRVITRFLDDRARAGLYPTGAAQWPVLCLESLADGMMDSAVSMVYEGRLRPEDKQWDGWVDAQWTKVERGLQHLEAEWLETLKGDLSMGTIAVAAMLGYLDFRHDARGWRTIAPGLSDWFRDHSTRPAMVATRPG